VLVLYAVEAEDAPRAHADLAEALGTPPPFHACDWPPPLPVLTFEPHRVSARPLSFDVASPLLAPDGSCLECDHEDELADEPGAVAAG